MDLIHIFLILLLTFACNLTGRAEPNASGHEGSTRTSGDGSQQQQGGGLSGLLWTLNPANMQKNFNQFRENIQRQCGNKPISVPANITAGDAFVGGVRDQLEKFRLAMFQEQARYNEVQMRREIEEEKRRTINLGSTKTGHSAGAPEGVINAPVAVDEEAGQQTTLTQYEKLVKRFNDKLRGEKWESMLKRTMRFLSTFRVAEAGEVFALLWRWLRRIPTELDPEKRARAKQLEGKVKRNFLLYLLGVLRDGLDFLPGRKWLPNVQKENPMNWMLKSMID